MLWDGPATSSCIKRDYRLRDEDQPFGLRLIAAQLFRDRRLARDIGVAAIVLSLLALGPIMFWRLLIDRVLYFHSLDTLAVLCVTMLVLIIFETIFGYLRRYLVLACHRPGRRQALHLHVRQGDEPATRFFRAVLGRR